jgi:hypothetical protein
VINLKCDQDLAELGIINAGGWNMLAFWDHLDSCDKCREDQAALIDELNKVISGERDFSQFLSSHG